MTFAITFSNGTMALLGDAQTPHDESVLVYAFQKGWAKLPIYFVGLDVEKRRVVSGRGTLRHKIEDGMVKWRLQTIEQYECFWGSSEPGDQEWGDQG
jgi:hypothetical protein